MVEVQLKFVEEGLKHPIAELKNHVTKALFEDDILVKEGADLDLKIKFTTDNDQDLILLQLRETVTKNKLNEKVLHYIEETWIQDIAAEAHALVSSVVGVHH
jgi:hypothetical protein